MTTETVLTDEQIESIIPEYTVKTQDGNVATTGPRAFARAIEQAVLQSPEVQQMRMKAARYDYLRDVLRHENGEWERVAMWNHENIPAVEFDAAIDAAMEKKS